MSAKKIAIGCSSGFWGDSPYAARQLVENGKIDYLVADYLSEVTMSLLARAKQKDAAAGYTPDFVESLIPLLKQIKDKKIRILSNAGGINPHSCRKALETAAAAAGVSFKIAVIEGDDLMPSLESLKAANPKEMFSGAAFPDKILSCNAYLGGRPIAAALEAGADIVITGRVADSALVLGILMHAFGWTDDQHDLLAAGSLAGHVVECGAQATGGVFTDWEKVADGWDNMGFPIVECLADGSFLVTKPEGTNGFVTPETVAEQIVYEIGDPRAYILPDVVCDFSNVSLTATADGKVLVTGAKGHAPTPTYKVSATFSDGWRVIATLMVGGRQAAAKARRMGESITKRAERFVKETGMGSWKETNIEVIGSGDTYGRFNPAASEVILKMGLRHDKKEALEIFAKEMFHSVTGMAQGTTGVFAGRPSPSPVVRLFSFLVDKQKVPAKVLLDGRELSVTVAAGKPFPPLAEVAPALSAEPPPKDIAHVPLAALALTRSGDKGNHVNIGVIARRAEFVPILRRELTAARVKGFFSHYVRGEALRWELPGFQAFNFLMKDGLDGGGMASLRYDAQGKTWGQMLLDIPVAVPAVWVKPGGILANAEKLEKAA